MLWRLLLKPSVGLFQTTQKVKVSTFKSFVNTLVKSKPDCPLRCQKTINKWSVAKIGICLVPGIGIKLSLLKSADCEPLKKTKPVKLATRSFDWKKLLYYLSYDAWSLLGAVFAALVVAYFNIQIPFHLGKMINVMGDILMKSEAHALVNEMKKASSQLIIQYLGQAVATFIYISLLSGVGERLAVRLRCELFQSILRQDLEFFDASRTGELVDCLTTDVQEFKSSFKMCISQGLRSITQIAGSVATLFIISPTMTYTMLLIVPTVIIIGTMLGSLLRSISHKAQAQAVKATTLSEEVISNIRTVRAFANEKNECMKFEQELEEANRLYIRLGQGIGMFQAGTNLFLNGLVLGTLYLGGHLMLTQNLSAGSLMSFLVALQTIQRSLAQLSLLFGHFIKGKQAGIRIFNFTNLESSIPLSGGKKIGFHSFVPNIEFKNVTFAYPTRPSQVILKDLNLSLQAGKTVAIVGTSGNGKSTIAALLERFYDINDGSITIGGVDIRDLDPSWLRGSVIGMINQEPVLFATSVKENIRYGKPNATDEEVYSAAKLANAHNFIERFPNGYDTVLGERGVTVSGGQKQRIAIARALIKNPAILILDEATSALDPESEKVVQQTLEKVCQGRTVLVIAHRMSTIQNANIIVVLNKGIIVEKGNHKTLYQQKGVYYNLMNQENQEK